MIVLMISVFSTNSLFIESVDALSDSRQLVLDAWTLVNEGFYDPEKFDEIQWKRIRPVSYTHLTLPTNREV